MHNDDNQTANKSSICNQVHTPNMNSFPLTTTDAAPERGGGTHEVADSVTRDHVRDCRSVDKHAEGEVGVGPAAVIAMFFAKLIGASCERNKEFLYSADSRPKSSLREYYSTFVL